MRLATTFKPHHSRQLNGGGDFLTRDELQHRMPSVFAPAAHDSRSARYTHIPTHALLDRFDAEGWRPTFAAQSIVRDESRQGHVKHMLRFRRADALNREYVPELVLVNSHDGSTAYQLLAGVFRFLCTNGLVVGDDVTDIRIPHRGNVIDAVLEGAETVRGHFNEVLAQADAMRSIMLSERERLALATAAVHLRFDETTAIVEPSSLLVPRRVEDVGHDLWRTYNVIQERLIGGGTVVRSRDNTARRRRARAIHGVNQTVSVNRALWTLASEMQRIRALPAIDA